MRFRLKFSNLCKVIVNSALLLLFFPMIVSAEYVKPLDTFPDRGGFIGFGAGPYGGTYHNGADFASTVNTEVRAIRDGYVIYSKEANGFGSLNPSSKGGAIIIRHQDNSGNWFYAIYGHIYRNLRDNNSGQPGEFVNKGRVIGTIRPFYNGSNFWPHLHFGIYNGNSFPTSGWGYSASLANWHDPKPTLDAWCGPMVGHTGNAALTVYEFWKKSDPICADPNGSHQNQNFDAQYKIKNTGSQAVTITRLALAVHYSDNSFWFDLKLRNTSTPRFYDNLRLNPGDSHHFDRAFGYFTGAGSYKVVAKALVNGQWNELMALDFNVIDCGGPGNWDYCTTSSPCSSGQGDCDSNSECQGGLICKGNVGANYGWPSGVDVCEGDVQRGDWDYCKLKGPCSSGQGDCDSDSECRSGLICKGNVGANYGWSSGVDVCESPSAPGECGLPNGHWSYCRQCGPCSSGQGDCDSDSECQSGLKCKGNIGANYGWSSGVDVCEGGCNLPNGHWSYCRQCGPCSSGQGDCDRDSECQSGLTCKQNVGANYGWSSGVDVCE